MDKKFVEKRLELDFALAEENIVECIRSSLRTKLRKRGLVVAVSGGIDSSVCLALAVKAVGPDKVCALILPEEESSSSSKERAMALLNHFNVKPIERNISAVLDTIGCYTARIDAVKKYFPDFDDRWKFRIVIKGGSEGAINHFVLEVENPSGEIESSRLDSNEYLEIVSSTNYKQRIRKTIEYYYADKMNYAVIGTPNKLEYDLGFFVRNGDGSADIKPIAHLFKTQVYMMAKHLSLPEINLNATPTTDTYSMSQGQDDFYFALPYWQMDVALDEYDKGSGPEGIADLFSTDVKSGENIFNDIKNKKKAADVLSIQPIIC